MRYGTRDYEAGTGRWTAKDRVLFYGGPNVYAYADNDALNFFDPTGQCPPSITGLPCTPGEVTWRRSTRSTTLQEFAQQVATYLNVHVAVHSGDRRSVPRGGSRSSQHLTTDLNPNAWGAIDFHLYDAQGCVIGDEIAAFLIT